MKNLIFAVFLLLLMIPSINALTCDTSTTPSYNQFDTIDWSCNTGGENTTCYALVKYNQTLISAMPLPRMNELNTGVLEGYECNGICKIQFSTEDLKTDRDVTFEAVCGAESVNMTVSPDWRIGIDSETSIDRIIYIKDNVYYILGIIVFGMFASMLLTFLWSNIFQKHK